jgi:hypothetical protein
MSDRFSTDITRHNNNSRPDLAVVGCLHGSEMVIWNAGLL